MSHAIQSTHKPYPKAIQTPYQLRHMYNICTILVQYLYVYQLYIYCTSIVHILYNGRSWYLENTAKNGRGTKDDQPPILMRQKERIRASHQRAGSSQWTKTPMCAKRPVR